MQYDGGFLAALCLDFELRERTGGERGLDELMRRLFARAAAGQREYALGDVVTLAIELAGEDEQELFDRHVTGRDVLPLLALESGGLEVVSKQDEERLERGYAIHDVLHIQSLTQAAGGLVIRRSSSAGYQDDDVLQAIGDRDVRTFEDVQRVLRDEPPGRATQVALRRGDAGVTLPITLGGRADPPLELGVSVRAPAFDAAHPSLLDRILKE